jgi:FtsZ-interacting cell division protein YlmF
LEKRLSAVESAAEAGAPEPPSQGAEELTPEVLEASRLRRVEMHQRAIDEHWKEPVDKAWASSTASQFEEDFGAIEEKSGLKLMSVDCKSQSCVATVEWKNYDEAQQKYDEILHHSYATNCTREILLPEPANKAVPYQATAVFNCKGSREPQEH